MNIPNIPSPIQTKKTPPVVVSPTPNRGDYRTDQSRLSESNAQNTVQNQRSSRMQEPQERKFDLSSYPAPHPASPLAKNLGKLLPPNEATVSFFSALFSENG